MIACARHPNFEAQTACPRCGTFSCVACFEGSELCVGCRQLGAGTLPWDDRRRLGTWRAFWKTVPAVMLRPDSTFANCAREGGAFDALLFLALSSFLSLVTNIVMLGLMAGGTLAFAASQGAEGLGKVGWLEGLGFGTLVLVIYLLLFWASQLAFTLTMALLDHVLVRLFRGAGTFSVTLRANALASAPAVIGLIPCCSLVVWPAWALVAKVFAYRSMHRLPPLQAAVAALVPTVATLVILGGGYTALMVAAQAFK